MKGKGKVFIGWVTNRFNIHWTKPKSPFSTSKLAIRPIWKSRVSETWNGKTLPWIKDIKVRVTIEEVK